MSHLELLARSVFPVFTVERIKFGQTNQFQAIAYEGQDKNPEMCRVLLTHEVMCRFAFIFSFYVRDSFKTATKS